MEKKVSHMGKRQGRLMVGSKITFQDHLAQKDRKGTVTAVNMNAHGLLMAVSGRTLYYVEKDDVIEVA